MEGIEFRLKLLIRLHRTLLVNIVLILPTQSFKRAIERMMKLTVLSNP